MPESPISYLFVPASRPERFEKALSSAAHAVIIDLEDAVAPGDKDDALGDLLHALDGGLSRPAYVRINSADSQWAARDVAALAGLSRNARQSLAGVFVPKVEHSDAVWTAREGLLRVGTDVPVVALIESAEGVALIRELAAIPGLTRFAVGAADLSFDLDCEITSATIDWVYARLVVESRRAGLPGPVASPPFEMRDHSALEQDSRRLRRLGATAQMCIHPAQIDAVHRAFSPGDQEVTWATRVLAAADHQGAVSVDGQMIDKPLRERAERILSQQQD